MFDLFPFPSSSRRRWNFNLSHTRYEVFQLLEYHFLVTITIYTIYFERSLTFWITRRIVRMGSTLIFSDYTGGKVSKWQGSLKDSWSSESNTSSFYASRVTTNDVTAWVIDFSAGTVLYPSFHLSRTSIFSDPTSRWPHDCPRLRRQRCTVGLLSRRCGPSSLAGKTRAIVVGRFVSVYMKNTKKYPKNLENSRKFSKIPKHNTATTSALRWVTVNFGWTWFRWSFARPKWNYWNDYLKSGRIHAASMPHPCRARYILRCLYLPIDRKSEARGTAATVFKLVFNNSNKR